ncbi:thioesterase [Frondihabitans sp. PAMC 28766]|uniref:acyl-CoA thioesterase n=1 Tax=Frondihabitans sp. PAMC 28766 TaxID=1795630 RepID=UPI00078D89D4|nr:thioesterase family protein [Frondihabitans sp. PAMC 28766]AMM20665.1 thioesterase [Frondihabitans sp. PAMC 28766]
MISESTAPNLFTLVVPTRWNDNDMYGHLNNTVYYAAMDTTINTWMIRVAGLDPLNADYSGYCVASSCEFKASAAFPDEIAVELAVSRIGTSSVTWAPRILKAQDSTLLADGTFTTVFVDRQSRRPTPIPTAIRHAIEAAFAVPTP